MHRSCYSLSCRRREQTDQLMDTRRRLRTRCTYLELCIDSFWFSSFGHTVTLLKKKVKNLEAFLNISFFKKINNSFMLKMIITIFPLNG